MKFDIFCRVIDNYGDIGVCWRLAQQLSRHASASGVRLWVDDLQRCRTLVPEVEPSLSHQLVRQVELVHWTDSPSAYTPYDVVIEAFACDPPAEYLQQLTPAHVWINLEYLSAEDWVESCHGLVSPQHSGLKKYFFFPGFTPATGGLLREPDLLARRNAWLSQENLRWELLQNLGVSSDAISALQQGALQVLLFCYPHAPVGQLLQQLSAAHEQAIVLLPEGVQANLPAELPANVRVQHIPFVPQQDFDALLWSSDLNCIRGEDSLVRALWAGRPLLWHIYAQDEDAHLVKLDAWLARSPYPEQAQVFMRHWNLPDTLNTKLPALPAGDAWKHWQDSATQWLDSLSQMPDLVSSLLALAQKQNA